MALTDTEIVKQLRLVAGLTESDVMSDDIELLADSFESYSNLQIPDSDEFDETYEEDVTNMYEVRDWLEDELDKQGVPAPSDSIIYSPTEGGSIYVDREIASDIDLPDPPHGWEWEMKGLDKKKKSILDLLNFILLKKND